MAAGRDRTLKLVAIARAGGLFSGLFGVGGGAVIVPLLLLWLGYDEREAAATSLGAIALIAAFATLTHVVDGLLVGVPAVGGVLAGTWLQQRVPADTIALAFSLLLVVAALRLVLA
jgi:uncharacterized membrane protein YfcA